MLRAAALSSLLVAAVATVAVACGESQSGSAGDPGSLVPARASVYVEAAVQPEGDRRDDALAALGKIMKTDDPAAKLRSLIDDALAEEGDGLTWERDFASWIGEDAGVWASDVAADSPSFAVVIATKDADAAREALGRFEKTDDSEYTSHSYHGVDYRLDDENTAIGVVDDFVVIGSETGFRRSVDARDGDKLIDSDRYKDAIDELDDDRLGSYYVDVAPLIDAAIATDPSVAPQIGQIKSFFPYDKLGPITGSFQADGDGMSLDTVVTDVPDGPFRQLAQLTAGGSDLLGDLPGDAWAAFVTRELGKSSQSLFNGFAGALGGAAIAGQVKEATGLDLQDDVFSWVGDAGGFVRGTDQASLDGGLVITSTDDDKAETAFPRIVGLIAKESGARPEPRVVAGAEAAFALAMPGADKPLILARGQGRVVATYGEQAAAAGLAPESELGDSPGFDAAKDLLGDDMDPVMLLDLGEVIRLADATGGTDAEFDKARQYLEALGVLTAGGSSDDDTLRSRVAVTLE
jgi:hypothetical protein